MDERLLEDIGLSRAEIKVYLALLDLGVSTSGPIIRRTKLQSSVVHRALAHLIDNGLVSFILVGKNRQYQATAPKSLVNYIDDKREQLQRLLPQLEARGSSRSAQPSTEMFFGKAAIFRLLNDTVASGAPGDEYLSFTLVEPHGEPDVVRFYQQYNLKRRALKLRVKVLGSKKVRRIFEQHYSKELLRKAGVRYADLTLPQGLIVFHNSVIFLNWEQEPFAVRVTSALMASQYRAFFLGFYNKEKDAY